MNTSLIVACIAVVMFLNIVAIVHVWRIDGCSIIQKVLQSLLICLIPILGSVIMLSFHLSDKEYVIEQKMRKGMSAKLINLLTFISFSAGSSRSILGAEESVGNSYDGCDSNAGDGGAEC